MTELIVSKIKSCLSSDILLTISGHSGLQKHDEVEWHWTEPAEFL